MGLHPTRHSPTQFVRQVLSLDLAAIDQRLRDCHLIDILQLIAKTQTACNSRNLHRWVGAQALEDLEERRFALDRCIERKNHLADLATCNIFEQQVDLQIRRSNALHRRDHTAQNVIDASILARILNRQHVGNLLHNADRRVIASLVSTYRTHIGIRQIVTQTAVANLRTKTVDTRRHILHTRHLHTQQVHRQAQRRTTTNTRELRQLGRYIFQKS